jgi:P4 family phage/plasmid primase-like protien
MTILPNNISSIEELENLINKSFKCPNNHSGNNYNVTFFRGQNDGQILLKCNCPTCELNTTKKATEYYQIETPKRTIRKKYNDIYTYLKDRCITQESIDFFNLTQGIDGKFNDVSLRIPCDVGYYFRLLNKGTKDNFKGGFIEGAKKGIFNTQALNYQYVFICEGQLDAISIHQCKSDVFNAISSNSVSRALSMLLPKDKCYILAIDNDEQSDKYRDKIKKRFNIKYDLLEVLQQYQVKDVNELLIKLKQEQFDKVINDFISKKEPEEKKLKHNEIGDLLIEKYQIKKYHSKVVYYLNDIYNFSDDDTNLLKHLCLLYNQEFKNTQRLEIANHIKDKLYLKSEIKQASYKYIACNNGILNINTMELQPFNQDLVFFNKIPYDFNVNAQSKLLEDTLNIYSNFNETVKTQILECIGYCCYRNLSKFRKSFIFLGKKRSGKSSMLDIITQLIGSYNISNLELDDLNDRFKPVKMFNKLVNIGDDIEDKIIKNTSKIKKIISGNEVTIEEKNKPNFSYKNYATMIFSANNLPMFNDNALHDRFIVIPFTNNLDNYGAGLFDIEELFKNKQFFETLLLKSILAFKKVLERGEFTINTEMLKEWEYASDPLAQFINDYCLDNIYTKPTNYIFGEYQTFIKFNNLEKLDKLESIRKFNKEIKERYNVKIDTRNGRKVFIK